MGHLPLFLLKDFEKHKPPFCWPPATSSQPPNHRPGSLVVGVHNSAVTPASRPHAAARRDAIYPGADWKGESKPMATELPGRNGLFLKRVQVLGSRTERAWQLYLYVYYIELCAMFFHCFERPRKMISNEYEYSILELCETWQSPAKIQNYVPNGDLVMICHSSTDNTDKTNHLLNTSKHTWSHKNPFCKCSKAVDLTIYLHLNVFSTQPPMRIHNNL